MNEVGGDTGMSKKLWKFISTEFISADMFLKIFCFFFADAES